MITMQQKQANQKNYHYFIWKEMELSGIRNQKNVSRPFGIRGF